MQLVFASSLEDFQEMPNIPRCPYTILVVDDESLILTYVASVLRSGGLEILEARNGQDALKILESCRETIPLLVTDVNMAPMNGVELAKAVRSLLPEIRVLFMTGFTEEFLSDEVISKNSELLRKPFSPALLLEKVRTILQGSISASRHGPTEILRNEET